MRTKSHQEEESESILLAKGVHFKQAICLLRRKTVCLCSLLRLKRKRKVKTINKSKNKNKKQETKQKQNKSKQIKTNVQLGGRIVNIA